MNVKMILALGALGVCSALHAAPLKLSQTLDFLDNCFFTHVPEGYYTKEELRKHVQQAKDNGFRKIYFRDLGGCSYYDSKVRHKYFGDTRWDMAQKLVKTIETYDPVAEYIKVCHELGMELYYWDPIFDLNGYDRLYPGMEGYEKWGENPTADRVLRPELTMEHRMNAVCPLAGIDRPIATIRVLVWDADVPADLTDRDILLFTGPHGQPFKPYEKSFTVTQEDAPQGRIIVLSGLSIEDPVIKFASDTVTLTTDTRTPDDVRAFYADGQEVDLYRCVEATVSGDPDRIHLLRAAGGRSVAWGKSRTDQPGGSLIVRFGDFDRYAKGLPEFAYPECRQRMVDIVTELYERYPDLDGVTLSIRSHTLPACGFHEEVGGNFFYGFSEPIVQEYKRRYGTDLRTQPYDETKFLKLRGEYITQMLDEVGAVVHAAGGKLEMMAPVSPGTFAGINPPINVPIAHGSMFPWWYHTGIDDMFDIRTWAQRGSVDLVLMLGTGYQQPVWTEAWANEVRRFKEHLAGTKTKLGLHYLVNDARESDMATTLPAVFEDENLDEVEFYEQHHMYAAYPYMYPTLQDVLHASSRRFAHDEVAWTELSTAVSAKWADVANWQDAAGTPLAVAPTNAANAWQLAFPALTDKASYKVITTGQSEASGNNLPLAYPAVNPSVESMAGVVDAKGFDSSMRYVINHGDYVNTLQNYATRYLSVADLTGFYGKWRTSAANCGFELLGTSESVTELAALSAKCRPTVKVPANREGAVTTVCDGGAVVKTGEGKLTVSCPKGESTRVIVNEGTVAFGSDDDALAKTVMAQAALHLDASEPDSIVYATAEQVAEMEPGEAYKDLKYVANWLDTRYYSEGVHNGANYYNVTTGGSYIPRSRAAFLNDRDVSPTGLPLMDFGSIYIDQNYGPMYCLLRLTKKVSEIREVHWTVSYSGDEGSAWRTCFGGVNADWPRCGNLGRGSTTVFLDGCEGVYRGDMIVNGEPLSQAEAKPMIDTTFKDHVNAVSLSLGGDSTDVYLLGCDRLLALNTGGMRMGEILFFTNVLTRAERLAVNRYLQRKWVTGADEKADADAVVVSSGSAGIEVAAGKATRVGAVSAPNGFVKKGEGDLVVGQLSAASVEIEGGTVSVAATAGEIPDDAPAADPWIWLDANDADSRTDVKYEGDPRTYVTGWQDHGGAGTAAAAVGSQPRLPYLVPNAVGDLTAISLGSALASPLDTSYFTLPNWGSTVNSVYAGFIVVRRHQAKRGYNIFGSSTTAMLGSSASILSSVYIDRWTPSARWTLNGVPVDPLESDNPIFCQTDDFFVMAFRSDTPVLVNAIAKDRSGFPNNCGDIEVGEFIAYQRPISLAEMRKTEAYLLKRWFGKAHPASKDAMSCPSTAISVSGGPLNLDFGTLEEIGQEALYWFDASDGELMTKELRADGKTYVTEWPDHRQNGSRALSYKGSNACMEDPTLKEVEVRPGVMGWAVDFGGRRHTTNGGADDAAGMYFTGFDDTQVREVFTVFADAYAESGAAGFFLSSRYNQGGLDVFRGPDWSFFNDVLARPDIYTGYLAIDGADAVYTDAIPSGYHVVSVGAKSAFRVDSMAMDRNLNAGGHVLCEQIAFSRELTSAERRDIERLLMNKWFDGRVAFRTGSLALGTNGALNIGSDYRLTCASLSIGGSSSFVGAELATTDGLSVTIGADGTVPTLSVTGKATFDDALAVTLAVADVKALEPGSYTILSATEGIEGANVITVDADTAAARYVFEIRKVGKTLVLTVGRRGLTVIIR